MFMRRIPLGAICVLAVLGVVQPIAATAAETTVLTLGEALHRSLKDGPDLKVATEELRAVEAEALLAGRLPNPELTVTLENVAGEGSYNGTDAAEFTVELSQPIELGGKRQLRREAADLGQQLTANRQKLARTGVMATTRQRFVAVQTAQAQLTLAKELAELTTKSLGAADERIKAGKAPTIDRLRLQGQAGLADLAVAQAERTLETARQALAASWGATQPDFDRVEGDLSILPAVPALTDLDTGLAQSVEVINQQLATQLLGNELARAKASRLPDPSLTVGWRQFKESDEDAWLFGVSVPLPLFSQGQDAVAAASSRFASAKARELSERQQARATLRSAWQSLADARAEAEVLDTQVVPAATEGFAAADFGYRAGKFGLLELLDAQRTLFETRQQLLAARTSCHLAAIELQRLQGLEPVVATQQLPTP